MWGINLSGQSLADEELLDFVLDQFERKQILPEKICFEITETAAIANLKNATHFIKALKNEGCHFALDDFGSGLSSFAYLKNLPVDFLKIDGLFVKNMANDDIDFAMVKAINDVGQVMGKQTIAEFVEDDAIMKKLEIIGVNYAQGYGISEPKPLMELY
jgi:EAL domain-containing protein (putative c-di-GMP-specific phosphodiesterase class I)